jgi:predicted nuclease of predicted toxin-antitoxin system
VKWLADENFDNDILRGIRRRVDGFDVVRAQDVAEISGSDDPAVLAWATTNNRVILTHDLSTMIPAIQEQVKGQRIAPTRTED